MKFYLCLFCLFFGSVLYCQLPKNDKSNEYIFYQNQGQILDQFGNVNHSILYLGTGDGLNLHLKQDGFAYDFFTLDRKKATGKDAKARAKLSKELNVETSEYDETGKFHRIEFRFVDANPLVKILEGERSLDYDNFIYTTLESQESKSYKVHRYKTITYQNIYPNIDLEFFKSKNTSSPFEYNFVIRPGGKLSDIKFEIKGGSSQIEDRHIKIKTRFGYFIEKAPLSWAEISGSKENIPISLIKNKGGIYGFKSTSDRFDNLVRIDPYPERLWGTYFGGSGMDELSELRMDSKNNLYLTGASLSPNAIATSGTYQNQLGSNLAKGFVAKFTEDGERIWGTYIGGPIIKNNSHTLDVDSTYSVYSAGEFIGKGSAAYFLKLNSDGSFGYLNRFGGVSPPGTSYYTYSIKAGDGVVYLTGSTNDPNTVATPGAWMSSLGRNENGFLTKFNAITGEKIWGTYINGISGPNALVYGATPYRIVESRNGVVSIVGISKADYVPNKNAFYTDGGEVFFMRFDEDKMELLAGGRLGSEYMGAVQEARIVDNKLIVTSSRNATNVEDLEIRDLENPSNPINIESKLYITRGSFQTNQEISTSSFDLPMVRSNNKSLNNTYIDKCENVFFSTATNKTSTQINYSTSGAFKTSTGASKTAIFGKINNKDVIEYVSYYGGNGRTYGNNIVKDNNDKIFIGGQAYKNTDNEIATSGSYQQQAGSANLFDMWFAKFKDNGGSFTASASNACYGQSFQLFANGGETYEWTGPNGFYSTLQNPIITNATELNSGIYNCLISVGAECRIKTSVEVTVKKTPVPAAPNPQTFCVAAEATVSDLQVDGTDIKYYDASQNLIPGSTPIVNGGIYYVTQTLEGCESEKVKIQVVITSENIVAMDFSKTFCSSKPGATDTVNLTQFNSNVVTNPALFTFSYYDFKTGKEIMNPTAAELPIGLNDIWIKISSNPTCFKRVHLYLTILEKPTVILPENSYICLDETSILLDAGEGFSSYLWNTGETTRMITASTEGNYSVTVKNAEGCSNSASTKVSKISPASITSLLIVNDKDVSVQVVPAGNYEYSLDGISWQISNVFTNVEKGVYTVYVRIYGKCIVATRGLTIFNIPNVFTPDGDGINDAWVLEGSSNYPDSTVEIFDRNGSLIFTEKIESSDFSWNGSYNGKPLQTGSYWYVLKVTDGRVYKGWVLLKNRS